MFLFWVSLEKLQFCLISWQKITSWVLLNCGPLYVEVTTQEGFVELGFHQAESSPNVKYLITCGWLVRESTDTLKKHLL